jgi:hypothetical protein
VRRYLLLTLLTMAVALAVASPANNAFLKTVIPFLRRAITSDR